MRLLFFLECREVKTIVDVKCEGQMIGQHETRMTAMAFREVNDNYALSRYETL
jgi:hypothetical protein